MQEYEFIGTLSHASDSKDDTQLLRTVEEIISIYLVVCVLVLRSCLFNIGVRK